MYKIKKDFKNIAIAHRLTNQILPEGMKKKCLALHGHNYSFTFEIFAYRLANDMVLDYNMLKPEVFRALKLLHPKDLDHSLLVFVKDKLLLSYITETIPNYLKSENLDIPSDAIDKWKNELQTIIENLTKENTLRILPLPPIEVNKDDNKILYPEFMKVFITTFETTSENLCNYFAEVLKQFVIALNLPHIAHVRVYVKESDNSEASIKKLLV